MGADIGKDIFTFTLKLFIYNRNSGGDSLVESIIFRHFQLLKKCTVHYCPSLCLSVCLRLCI